MKKLLFIPLACLLATACTMKDKKEDAANTSKDADMKTLYEQHLAIVKNCISSFEKNDINAFAGNIAENCVWNSPAYGDTMTSKAHWMETLKGFEANMENPHLSYSLYLPGLDSTSHNMDGSARFYGLWEGTSKATHQPVKLRFYGAYEFDKGHKIVEADEFFDAGGLVNALMPKK